MIYKLRAPNVLKKGPMQGKAMFSNLRGWITYFKKIRFNKNENIKLLHSNAVLVISNCTNKKLFKSLRLTA